MPTARHHQSQIEVLEPLVLMSAAAADVDFDELGTGTPNSDLLLATAAGSRVDGEGGDDRLIGAAGDNALDAGAGDDQLISLRGDNVLTGGTGVDTAVYLDGASGDYTVQDLGFGGIVEVAGKNRADLLYSIERIAFRDGTFAVEDLLDGGGEPIGFERDGQVEDLTAAGLAQSTNRSDVLAAVRAGERIDGAAGNDLLIAVAGDNELLGGPGDDDFVTHRGRNTIDGGAGRDRVLYAVGRTDVFVTDLGDGSLRLESPVFHDVIRNVELLDFNGAIIATEDLEADAAMLPSVSVLPAPPIDLVAPPVPAEPDAGTGEGADSVPIALPVAFPMEPGEAPEDRGDLIATALPTSVPVEQDDLISDEAGPTPVALPTSLPTESDAVFGDSGFEDEGLEGEGLEEATLRQEDGDEEVLDKERDGGLESIPVFLPTSVSAQTGGVNSGEPVFTVTSEDSDTAGDPQPSAFPIEVPPTFVATISGTDASEWISGTSADDVIVAGGGDDEIHAPVGNNQVDGGDGIDTLVIYEGYRAQYLFAVRSDGVTTISGPGLNGETVTVDLLNVERIQFNDGVIDLSGPSTVVPQPPSSGNTRIEGTDASEWIGGTPGNDEIVAKGGDDEIYAALGENQIDGGAGTDTLLVYGDRADFLLANSNGAIFMEGPGLNGETLRNTLVNVEQIQFTDQLVRTSDIPDLPITILPYPLPGDVTAEVSTLADVSGGDPAVDEVSATAADDADLVFASEPQVLPMELGEGSVTTGFDAVASDDFGQGGSAFGNDTAEMMAMATAARGLLDTMESMPSPSQLRTLFGEELGIDLEQIELRDRLSDMLRPLGIDLESMLSGDGFGASA